MPDDPRAMAAALQGGLLPAPAPTPDMIASALGSPLTEQHLNYPGDDPIAELSQQRFAKADPSAFAMGIMGGPRNLRLIPSGGNRFNINHDIIDPQTAERLGYMQLNTRDPKNLWVNMIDASKNIPQEGGGTVSGANALGPSSTRSLVNEIKELYPEAEKIGGYRVSGARVETGNGSRDAWLRIRPPSDPTELIDEAASAAEKRWQNTADAFRSQTNAALNPSPTDVRGATLYGNGIDRQEVLNRNMNREIGDPSTNEITARRNAVRMGQPNWSEVDPRAQDMYRRDVGRATPYGTLPNSQSYVVDPAAEQTTRNRWMSAQMGRATRQGNQATQAYIDDYNRRMAEVLSRGK